MSDAEDPVLRVLQGYKAAVFAKDVDAFVALYDPDVRVFDMWGEWSHEGIAAWRAMASGWFDSLGTDRVRVEFDALNVELAADLAMGQAYLRFAAIAPDDTPLRAMDNRITLVARKRGAQWKIVHQHTSAPADFRNGKVMFSR